jgi:2-desacetyl-2-hydroxyethyl bacteriochlorophyllide A dehydrogenase
MKTLVCLEPNSFEMQEWDVPRPAEGEALIRVRGIGVCGTDYHAYHGDQPYFQYPRVLGHEIVGQIADIAPGQGFRVGQSVTVVPYISCGHCVACRHGKGNACANLQVIGCHVDGAMREFLAVPIRQLVSTEGLSQTQAAVVEPLAIGLHGVHRAQVQAGEWVAVMGAGPIGLAAMKFAKLAGAKVMAIDVNPERLDFCRQWAQVDHVIDASADTLAQLSAITGGELAMKVIDATGNRKAMMSAFDYACAGGTVVYISLVLGDITFSDPDFHKKELTLCGSRAASNAEFAEVIAAILAGHVDAEPFITHRAPFEDAANAIQRWMTPGSGVIKALIEF